MYKTLWNIKTERDSKQIFCYHFGKRPYFPPHFLKEDNHYEIEMVWNLKLIKTFKIFLKCLFHKVDWIRYCYDETYFIQISFLLIGEGASPLRKRQNFRTYIVRNLI